MFSSVENDYLKGLLNVYRQYGYKYYVVHTVTETDNDYDMYVYLSKDEIVSTSSTDFELSDNSIVIYIDSSSRNSNSYNPSIHSRDTVHHFNGSLSVNIAEFIYTNSNISYGFIDDSINPDILMSGVNSYDKNLLDYSLIFIVACIFLYTFIKSILRLRR